MFSRDEIERARYLSRKMFRHDLATALDEATKKGEREGFENAERKGILDRIQLCYRLLNERQPTDEDFTALSNADLEELAMELEKRLEQKTALLTLPIDELRAMADQWERSLATKM